MGAGRFGRKGPEARVHGDIHLDPRQAAHDKSRDTHLRSIGCTVLRFSNDEVIKDLDTVRRQIAHTAAGLAAND